MIQITSRDIEPHISQVMRMSPGHGIEIFPQHLYAPFKRYLQKKRLCRKIKLFKDAGRLYMFKNGRGLPKVDRKGWAKR